MRKLPCAVALALTSSILAPPNAQADETVPAVPVESYEVETNAVHLSWSEVTGAAEYAVFEEIPKDSSIEAGGAPVYRGQDLEFKYQELEEGEVVRLRLLALDSEENVLARSMLRTSTPRSGAKGGDITWIADSDQLEIKLASSIGEYVDGHRPTVEADSQGLVQVTGESEIVLRDEEYSGEKGQYQVSTEHGAPAEDIGHALAWDDDPGDVGLNWNIEVPGFGENSQLTLSGESENVREALSFGTYGMTLAWDAFIEDQYVALPAVCVSEEAEGNIHLGGDDRGFGMDDYAGFGTSRVNLASTVSFMWPQYEYNSVTGDMEFTGFSDPSTSGWRRMGISSAYEEQPDGSMSFVAEETAPIDELEYEEIGVSQTSATFELTADASLPLCQVFGVFDAPAINIFVHAELYSDGSYGINGSRDAAPSHQSTLTRTYGPVYPTPSHEESQEAINNPMMRCIERHENRGFIWLAAPSEPFDFIESQPDDLDPGCF